MIVVPKFVASVSKVGPNRNPNSVDRQSRDFYPPTVDASPLTWLGFPGDLLKNALRVYPKPSLQGAKHQLKFFARGLAAPQLTQQWFELWQTPMLIPLVTRHPRLLLKLQRHYLRHGLSVRERWEILRQHYSFATGYFCPAALREIVTPPGILLAKLPELEAGRFSLRLAYDGLFEKEGELSVVFYDEQKHTSLFALSFCVSSWLASRREIFIGGLQGCKRANAREDVVAITRGMFGLRPKALLLFALQQVSACWDVQNLRAVSNETRDLRRRKQSIQADYDEFWLDSGGQLQADGNFTLPVVFIPRQLSEIKPNKRTMYRRRYRMLEDLGEQIQQHCDRLGRTSGRPFVSPSNARDLPGGAGVLGPQMG